MYPRSNRGEEQATSFNDRWAAHVFAGYVAAAVAGLQASL